MQNFSQKQDVQYAVEQKFKLEFDTQVKQITSQMQQSQTTDSVSVNLRRNSGWLCNAKGFFFLRYICKIPINTTGSYMQTAREEHTPEELHPTFYHCYLNVIAKLFLQFVYKKKQIRPRQICSVLHIQSCCLRSE